jgi:hypothetical protein
MLDPWGGWPCNRRMLVIHDRYDLHILYFYALIDDVFASIPLLPVRYHDFNTHLCILSRCVGLLPIRCARLGPRVREEGTGRVPGNAHGMPAFGRVLAMCLIRGVVCIV